MWRIVLEAKMTIQEQRIRRDSFARVLKTAVKPFLRISKAIENSERLFSESSQNCCESDLRKKFFFYFFKKEKF
jgi:hypothetical protein